MIDVVLQPTVSSSQISITNITNTTTQLHSITPNTGQKMISISYLQTGNYVVRLIVNGVISDTKILTVN